MERYLTEKYLGEVLKQLFPNNFFVHDKIVPSSGSKRRPDYRCEELKLIVEFDGYLHYTQASKIFSEEFKTNLYQSMGYKVVRIPYFVQLDKYVIRQLFDIDAEDIYTYPHGFIDKKCVLPCDFCELGVKKFLVDSNRFSKTIKEDIIKSLIRKIEDGDRTLFEVIPPSLEAWIKS